MWNLLKKDLRLALHPATLPFLALSAMVLIPNYPYAVVIFYSFLGLFFTSLNGRENSDVFYTLLLPVAKRDVVRARMVFAGLYQGAFLVLMVPFGILGQIANPTKNDAGLEPNLAFLGWALILFAVGNAVFFRIYYRNVKNVGKALLSTSIPLFVMMVAEIAATYAVPFVRDKLDTKDPEFLGEKLALVALGAAVYAVSFLRTMRKSERLFEELDVG